MVRACGCGSRLVSDLGSNSVTLAAVRMRMRLTSYDLHIIFTHELGCQNSSSLDEELQNLTDAVQEKLYASAAVIEQFDQRSVAREWTR